jgi:hypothetical protein
MTLFIGLGPFLFLSPWGPLFFLVRARPMRHCLPCTGHPRTRPPLPPTVVSLPPARIRHYRAGADRLATHAPLILPSLFEHDRTPPHTPFPFFPSLCFGAKKAPSPSLFPRGSGHSRAPDAFLVPTKAHCPPRATGDPPSSEFVEHCRPSSVSTTSSDRSLISAVPHPPILLPRAVGNHDHRRRSSPDSLHHSTPPLRPLSASSLMPRLHGETLPHSSCLSRFPILTHTHATTRQHLILRCASAGHAAVRAAGAVITHVAGTVAP